MWKHSKRSEVGIIGVYVLFLLSRRPLWGVGLVSDLTRPKIFRPSRPPHLLLLWTNKMGVQKKSRKFAQAKRAITSRDSRLCVPVTLPGIAAANAGPRKQNAKTDKPGQSGQDGLIREALVLPCHPRIGPMLTTFSPVLRPHHLSSFSTTPPSPPHIRCL